MKLAAALFLAAAVSATKVKPSLREQIGGENAPIILDNSAALRGAVSQVTATCAGGQVTLTLTNTGTPAIGNGEAQILIGACTSGRAPVRTGLSFETLGNTDGDDCGRTGDSNRYRWSVRVNEWYPRPGGLELGPFSATFSVECASGAEQPTEVPSITQPPPVTEGTAEFTGSVQFTLRTAASTTPRQWVLELEPVSVAALRGLSYTINNLVASTGTGTGRLSANLIASGCIADPLGVQVSAGGPGDQRTTIRVTAFQFSQSPGTAIDFTATVLLCTPPAPGGVCNPVKTEAMCDAEDAQPKGFNPQSKEAASGNEEPKIPRARPPSRQAVPVKPAPKTADASHRIRRSVPTRFEASIGKLAAKIAV